MQWLAHIIHLNFYPSFYVIHNYDNINHILEQDLILLFYVPYGKLLFFDLVCQY